IGRSQCPALQMATDEVPPGGMQPPGIGYGGALEKCQGRVVRCLSQIEPQVIAEVHSSLQEQRLHVVVEGSQDVFGIKDGADRVLEAAQIFLPKPAFSQGAALFLQEASRYAWAIRGRDANALPVCGPVPLIMEPAALAKRSREGDELAPRNSQH